MQRYSDKIEENSRVKILNLFRTEIMDKVTNSYKNDYGSGEEISWSYEGPMANTFTGPGATTEESNNSRYKVEGRNWELYFELTVVDSPYKINEIIDETGTLNFEKLTNSFKNFNPEKERSRIISVTPHASKEQFDNDRWHCFEKSLEEILEPEETSRENYQDAIYHFNLIDTQREKTSLD